MAEKTEHSFMGIDFGTTSCKFGYFINGKVEILEDEFGNKSMPSYVAFTEDGRLVGEKAKRQRAENPRNTVLAIKKLMGKSFEDAIASGVQFPDQLTKMDHKLCGVKVLSENQQLKLYPEQVAAMLFSNMKYLAEKKLKHPVDAAVISVPPGFNSCQRKATVNAGTIAGFDVVRLVDDSTALATAISHQMVGTKSENVAVVDFGGGFTSASMITVSESSFKELPSVTLEFGGIDIDQNIRDILKDKLINTNHSIYDDEKLRMSAEEAKIRISSQGNTSIFLKDEEISLTANDIYQNSEVSYKIVKLFDILKASIPTLIKNIDIDHIILTGEFTKSPFIKYLLTKLIEDREIKKFGEYPDLVITGAVLKSAVLRGLMDRKSSDSILNRTIKLDGDILFENDHNPISAISRKIHRGMIVTEYSAPTEKPISTGKLHSASWWKSISTDYICIDDNKIIHKRLSTYKVKLFCKSSKCLNDFKSLEDKFKDKEKKYED